MFGEISRVSREAPVLILRHRDRTVVPGGGANAICNLADLGVNVLPVGVVGDDEPENNCCALSATSAFRSAAF